MPKDVEIQPPKRYPKMFEECRARGHQWHHFPGLVDHPTYYTVKGTMSECVGCGAEVTRWMLSTGRPFGSPTMKYPVGYLLSRKDPQTPELPTRNDWRRSYIHSLGFREDAPKKKGNGRASSRNAVA